MVTLFTIVMAVVLLFPILSPYNMFLWLICRNPAIHIDKERYFPQHKVLEDPETYQTLRAELADLMNGPEVIPMMTDIFKDITIMEEPLSQHGIPGR